MAFMTSRQRQKKIDPPDRNWDQENEMKDSLLQGNENKI